MPDLQMRVGRVMSAVSREGIELFIRVRAGGNIP